MPMSARSGGTNVVSVPGIIMELGMKMLKPVQAKVKGMSSATKRLREKKAVFVIGSFMVFVIVIGSFMVGV